MSKLSEEQRRIGRERFLRAYPPIKTRIEGISQQIADSLGVELEELRQTETMRELGVLAKAQRIDSFDLFLSFIADSADELAEMQRQRDEAIQKALGL